MLFALVQAKLDNLLMYLFIGGQKGAMPEAISTHFGIARKNIQQWLQERVEEVNIGIKGNTGKGGRDLKALVLRRAC